MQNLIILGSGRSGTSMVTGVFHKAGYFMGDSLYVARPANPKGFFENEEINTINEEIISNIEPGRSKGILSGLFSRDKFDDGQRWLARVPVGEKMTCSAGIQERIRQLTAKEPFCFKDPRFSYTLPCWRPFLKDTRYLVAFRHPADTAKSIAKECKDAKYLHNLSISREEILECWRLMYSHILETHQTEGKWLFLHYDQVLASSGLDLLESFSGAQVDRTFPDKSLKRSVSNELVPADIDLVYKRLCQLADYPV